MADRVLFLADEAATVAFAARLARALKAPAILYLRGDLGAGKTTLARGLLRALGVSGPVKSPTYTLVEPYSLAGLEVQHFDLYRLADPFELEALGVRDLLGPDSLWLVEWPERGLGALPVADLELELRTSTSGRELLLRPLSAVGESILLAISSIKD